MFISNSADETFALGAQVGQRAQRGEILALVGDLGAGKTQFVKGFVAGTGSDFDVTSPTFTLVHEYGGGRLSVYHFDFYRLDDAAAVLALDFDEYIYGDGVCLIEWADKFRELVPDHARWITFRVISEAERAIEGAEAAG